MRNALVPILSIILLFVIITAGYVQLYRQNSPSKDYIDMNTEHYNDNLFMDENESKEDTEDKSEEEVVKTKEQLIFEFIESNKSMLINNGVSEDDLYSYKIELNYSDKTVLRYDLENKSVYALLKLNKYKIEETVIYTVE